MEDLTTSEDDQDRDGEEGLDDEEEFDPEEQDGALPPRDERKWLIEEMASLVRSCGAEPLLCAPLITPSDRSFPDRWLPDERGVSYPQRGRAL